MTEEFTFKSIDPFNTHKKRRTWERKKQSQAIRDSNAAREELRRVKELKKARKTPSLARGLTAYRKATGLTRTELAEQLEINRFTLRNYEQGKRPIPGDVLEKMVAQGDFELSDLFGLPPEPASPTQRLADAKLCIDALEVCRADFPDEFDDDAKFFIASEVVRWPVSVRRTRRNIERFVYRTLARLEKHRRQTGAYLHDNG